MDRIVRHARNANPVTGSNGTKGYDEECVIVSGGVSTVAIDLTRRSAFTDRCRMSPSRGHTTSSAILTHGRIHCDNWTTAWEGNVERCDRSGARHCTVVEAEMVS